MDILLFKVSATLGDACSYILVTAGLAVALRAASFPDLTCEGSFMLGGCAAFLMAGSQPNLVAMLVAAACVGAIAGAITAILHSAARVPPVLAGILTWMSAYSVGLRLLGRPNVRIPPDALLSALPADGSGLAESAVVSAGWAAVVAAVALLLVFTFLESAVGLRLRAVGENRFVARSLGLRRWTHLVVGLGVANGAAGLAGGLFAVRAGYVDVNMGGGILVAALASMFIGNVLLPGTGSGRLLLASILGSLVYRAVIAGALEIGLAPGDLRLVTGVLVVLALSLARLRGVRATGYDVDADAIKL